MDSVKRVSKRFLSLSLSLILVLLMLPTMTFPTMAATVSGLNDSSIGLDSSGDATWSANGASISGSVTGEGGTCSSSKSGTLTITNTKSITATLSFSYTVTLNGGTVSVAGSSVTAGGTYTSDIASGGSITINIASAKGASTTGISITDISLVADVQATITYLAPVNGSYTVDGTAITSQQSITKSSATATTLVATPASGYRFYGWHNVTNDTYFGFTATFSANFDTNITVEPTFIPSTAPVFDVSGKIFTDLNAAITYATNNSKNTIVLVANGTLPSGTYTIPNGKTLLIPFDNNHTVYTTAPAVVYEAHVTQSAFKTLTMANGSKIVVANGGKLCVPSKLSANGTNTGSWNGTPTGPHGRISMNAGSTIEVQNGGGLYAYGYISGSGLVDAKSGATVWEAFQFRCWRGGTATSNMRNKTVFPMSQYYCQNIETSLKLEQGATEKVYTSVNAQSTAYPTSCTFIGSGGMFVPSGTVTKRYDGATDRLIIDIDGNLTMSSMSMSLSIVSLNTADFVLPINSNITINVNSGTTTVNGQDLAFLPGSILNVANGATFNVTSGSDVYVYDQSEWGQYAAAGANLVVVGYSTVNGTTTKRNNNSLIDAKFDVNGTITVNGTLYTTSSGANITSSGKTGRIVYNAAAGTATTTQQVTQSGSSVTYVDIPITSAKLFNGDSSYTATAGSVSGDFYTYSSRQNKWIKGEDVVTTHTVTFKNASGTVIKTVDVEEGNTVPTAQVPALPATANNNNGTHTTYAWNADVTAPITADTTFTQVGTTVNCSLTTTASTAATCTAAGSTTQTCSVCGYSTTTTAPALGHNYQAVVTAPTCTAGGYTTYTCSRCGDSYTGDATAALGHNYGDWAVTTPAVAATCTQAGTTAVETRTCSRCGATETRGGEAVAAIGHTPAEATEENRTEATCTEDGSYDSVVYCSVCGAELSRETVAIPALGHNYQAVVTAPTCTAGGYTTYTCSRCGDSYTGDATEALGHNYGDWAVTTPAVAATCTQAGTTAVETRTCSRCGATETRGGEAVAALGHTPGEAVTENNVAPTCTVEGSYDSVVYCSVCGAELSRTAETVAALGHNYETTVVAATPNARGYTLHTCSRCGDSYQTDATPYASDDSVLTAAKELAANYDEDDYTPASYQALTDAVATTAAAGTDSQDEIDAATAAVLTAVSELAPYLYVDVSAKNADYTVNLDGENGHYTTAFGTGVTVTATPHEGYTFYGWYDTVSHHYVSDNTTYTFTAKTNISLKAVAVKAASASLIFQNDTGYIKRTITKTVAQWETVTDIAALEPELPYSYMQTVVGWDYDNDTVLAQLCAGNDVIVTPQYESASSETPEIPTATDEPVINILYKFDMDNNVGSYTIAPAVPADCTVEEIGIAYYYEYSDCDSFILSNFFLTNNNKLTASRFTYDANESFYTVNVRFSKWRQNNWCAKGYIVYRQDGKLRTAYSKQINVFDGRIQQ